VRKRELAGHQYTCTRAPQYELQKKLQKVQSQSASFNGGTWTEGKMGNGNEMMKGTIGALISQNVALKSQERKRSIQHVFAIGLLLALLAFLF